MFKNYLITALQFLKRDKLFAGINMLGLSLALAASFIILLFVINELSYDSCFKNQKQIYQILNYSVDYKITDNRQPYVLSKSIKDEFLQVNYVAPTKNVGKFSIKLNEDFIPVRNAIGTDSEIFKIFDIPVNSTLQADCFINSKWLLKEINQRIKDENAETSWNSDFWWTWLLLDKDAVVASLDEQFWALGEKDRYDFSVQNLTDVYLASQDINSGVPKGSMKNIRIFPAIAILIITVAAFNFIILSTAISSGRVKEIGIRKVNGAKVSEILSLLNKDFIKWVAIAFVIAVPIAYFAMNKWLENFAYKTTLSWWIFALAGVLALGIALLTVSWQSWRAATRNPVEALRYE